VTCSDQFFLRVGRGKGEKKERGGGKKRETAALLRPLLRRGREGKKKESPRKEKPGTQVWVKGLVCLKTCSL